MGFEDSDGVTHRFNYCRPATTRNFCCTSDRGFSSISALPARTPLDPAERASPRSYYLSNFFFLFFFRQRAQIFPPFLPEPQNDAKIRYRFAEAGLAADRATDLPRSKPSSSSSSPPASIKKYLIFRLFFFPSLFPPIRFPNGGKILKILNDLSSHLAIEKTDRV